ncbi:MAG TPA: 4-hydroxy-tetrahydrodipicolinate reductase [Polyangia bacterium]|nr:4-hydroxy-tetrahydrodipicolinate reductase [Polyangia bacterium]
MSTRAPGGAGPLVVGVNGAGGKMGRMIVKVLAETPGAKLGAAVEHAGSDALGKDAGALAGVEPLGVAIEKDAAAALARAQVMIDFTAPASTAELVARAAERKVAVVIGTTGLGERELEAVRRAAESTAIVHSANMSLGVNVLFGLLDAAARALGDAYDVEIVELHHRQKKDSPSGTALAMARVLADALGRDLGRDARYGREGQVGARTTDEIGVLAVRGGDIVGEHTAYFCGLGERLELTHRASSRETFARGAVRAAQWVASRAPGLYDMQDVLGLRR